MGFRIKKLVNKNPDARVAYDELNLIETVSSHQKWRHMALALRKILQLSFLETKAMCQRRWRRVGRSHLLTVVGMLAVCLASTWTILTLGYLPTTPAQDFATHIASIVNFQSALQDGQWIPRLQLRPITYPDIPLFQFYAWLLGAFAFPFLQIGLAPVTALGLGLVSAKCIAGVAVYASGRLLGASRGISFAASTSYLLSPYVLSNVLGRFAFPESTAHAVLPVLFYGLIRMTRKPDAMSILITGIGVIGLSLAHPIFLIYGLAAAGLFIMLGQPGLFVVAGLTLMAGFFAAAFQWLPSFLVRNEFSINFQSSSPFASAGFTSASGLVWFAQALADRKAGMGDEVRLFLTPGIMTIPAFLLVLGRVTKNRVAGSVAGLLVLFLFLSFSPFDVWTYAPAIALTVQFPYRLLVFVALFSSLALCIGLRSNTRPWVPILIVAVVALQSWPIIRQPLQGARLSQIPLEVAEQHPNFDYLAKPPLTVAGIASDGWFNNYAEAVSSAGMRIANRLEDADHLLLTDNSFNIGVVPLFDTQYLRLSGAVSKPTEIWIAKTSEPQKPLNGTQLVEKGTFSVLMMAPNDAGQLTIGWRGSQSITLKGLERLPFNGILVSPQLAGVGSLVMDGATIFDDAALNVWIARPEAPETPLTGTVSVGPGRFSASLRLPWTPGNYTIGTSRYLVPAEQANNASGDTRRLNLNLDAVFQTNENDAIHVLAADVTRTYRHGYTRIFQLKNPVTGSRSALIDLPIAYSSLLVVTQNGKTLPAEVSERRVMRVPTHDLASPISVQFRPPLLSIILTFVGILLLALLAWFFSQKGDNPRWKMRKLPTTS